MKYGIWNITLGKWVKEEDHITNVTCTDILTAKCCLDAVREIAQLNPDNRHMLFELREYK